MFREFLLSKGFKQSNTNKYLYILYIKGVVVIYIFVYINNILITIQTNDNIE